MPVPIGERILMALASKECGGKVVGSDADLRKLFKEDDEATIHRALEALDKAGRIAWCPDGNGLCHYIELLRNY